MKDSSSHVLKGKSSAQFSSVQFTQSCPTLYDPKDCSTPGLPVHHQLLEFTQTHIHRVGDAIQPSHAVVPFFSCPLSFPASGSFQMSQLFTSGGQSIGVSASTRRKERALKTDGIGQDRHKGKNMSAMRNILSSSQDVFLTAPF